MSEFLIPWALNPDTNRAVHVDYVDNGLECGAVCPSCLGQLVAKNRGTVKRHHFAHYNESASCEGVLHATGKLLLWERQMVCLQGGDAFPIRWNCKLCGCRHEADLLRKTGTVDLEKYVKGKIRPDIVAYDTSGTEVCLQEIVDTHKPSPVTHQIAEAGEIPLVVFHISGESDLGRFKSASPLTVEVDYPSCECDTGKCRHCGQRPCDRDYNPLPHRRCDEGPSSHCIPSGQKACYCPICKECPEDYASHRHCACKAVIYGDYRKCYCCWVGCSERETEHRHCRECRTPVYKKDRRTMLFFEKCWDCYQEWRDFIAGQIKKDAEQIERKQLEREQRIKQCVNCKYGCQYVCFRS